MDLCRDMIGGEQTTPQGPPTAMRVVMVEFKPGVSSQEVAAFRRWLERLADRSGNLVRMTCGEHLAAKSEGMLSADAPDVTFGHFVSVWEFSDEQALDEFVMAPFHRELAGNDFRRLVRHRYVINIRNGVPHRD